MENTASKYFLSPHIFPGSCTHTQTYSHVFTKEEVVNPAAAASHTTVSCP